MENIFGKEYLKELEAEATASRKCLERMKDELYEYKPHEKSMQMGYLALLLADIPKWITVSIEKGEVDFVTWDRFKGTTTAEFLEYFDKNIIDAKRALSNVSDKELEDMFYLKRGEEELMKSTKKENVSSSLNHWVHHRGQFSVYLRMNYIPVPSIYGPSADDKTF